MTHPLRVAENCTNHPQNLMTHPLSAPAHPPPPILFDQSLIHKISTRLVFANGKQPRFKTSGWNGKGFEVCFKLSASGSLSKEEVERERSQLLLLFVVVVHVRPFLFIVYLTNKFVTKLRPLKDIFMYTSFLYFL